jgi:hypothetical protein
VFDGVNVLFVNTDNTTGYQTVQLKPVSKQCSNDTQHRTMDFKRFALAFSVMAQYIFVVVKNQVIYILRQTTAIFSYP